MLAMTGSVVPFIITTGLCKCGPNSLANDRAGEHNLIVVKQGDKYTRPNGDKP
jgi:hypothetical protein